MLTTKLFSRDLRLGLPKGESIGRSVNIHREPSTLVPVLGGRAPAPCTRTRLSSMCRSVYSAFMVCRKKTDDAVYRCRPSTCRVLGNGAGSGVGGVYVSRTRGLYMLPVSSAFP